MLDPNIILLRLVGSCSKFPSQVCPINFNIATAGACATIASDALMNPFDGRFDHDVDSTDHFTNLR